MVNLYDCIANIKSDRTNWDIKVRVIRIWQMLDRNNSRVNNPIEMILVDEYGDQIQGFIGRGLFYLFKGKLVEGETYRIGFFAVAPNKGVVMCTHHPFKLIFHPRTSVTIADGFSIPKYGLRLVSPGVVSQLDEDYPYLVDVAGIITSLSTERNYIVDGRPRQMYLFELSDKSDKVQCLLLGDHAEEFESLMLSACHGLPIVVLQFVKITKSSGATTVQGVYNVTRILVNPDIAEFVQLRERLSFEIKDLNNCIYSPNIAVEEFNFENFTKYYPRKTLTELNDLSIDGIFAVLAEVSEVVEKEVWWYPICQCDRVMSIKNGLYWCNVCCLSIFYVVPKLNAEVVVDDGLGLSNFKLFEDVVPGLNCKIYVDLKDCAKRFRHSKERFDLDNLKGRKFVFGVHGISAIARGATLLFESCVLCSTGKCMETFILQGFNYTPTKCIFRPYFSPRSEFDNARTVLEHTDGNISESDWPNYHSSCSITNLGRGSKRRLSFY